MGKKIKCRVRPGKVHHIPDPNKPGTTATIRIDDPSLVFELSEHGFHSFRDKVERVSGGEDERVGSPERSSVEREEVEKKAPKVPEGLEGVDFASPEALDRAATFELTSEHFEGIEVSGKTGFTKGDVDNAILAKEAEESGKDE